MIDSSSKKAESKPETAPNKLRRTLAPFFKSRTKNLEVNIAAPDTKSIATNDNVLDDPKPAFDLTSLAARLTHDRPLVRPQDDELDMQELPEDTELADEHTNQQPFMSDTLSEIMKKQGKFDEARKAYFQLSRTNPKRALYYQTQIAALDVLQSRAD